ncbi:unnamed protein product [Cyprideis torosa]|uniref:Uncharacterized protein n=1 Tax=Cyprideis torosa TaxID=163714 RepID=A0A7R8ZVL7_9CRUS|nr:unnamed protein product [Cyprideis torosa]CAG0903555.1 unnamed protein product [Cyprideis torosa]
MSVGFLVPPEAAVIWRGPKKNGMIKQFLRDVDWGELDVLLVDSPPGTSDEHLSIVQLLSSSLSGAVIVSTPQEVALLDVRKEISFCRRVGLRVLGVVENMAEFVCPKCSKSSVIFPPTSGGVREMCAQMNVPFLGTIPLDPRIGKAIDEGADFFEEFGESPIGNAYKGIAAEMIKNCECSTEQPMEN